MDAYLIGIVVDEGHQVIEFGLEQVDQIRQASQSSGCFFLMQQTLVFCIVVQQYPTVAVRIFKGDEDSAVVIDDIRIGSKSQHFLLVDVSVFDLSYPNLIPSIPKYQKHIILYLLCLFEVNSADLV